jgi:hypothetical protein
MNSWFVVLNLPPEGFGSGPLPSPSRVSYFVPCRSGKIMRRLLRDITEGRTLGDTTTLADSTVVADSRNAPRTR